MFPASCSAVILMESNLGMTELEELLTMMGDRQQVRSQGCCGQIYCSLIAVLYP